MNNIKIVSAVHMMPVTDQVNIPFFKLIDEQGIFQPNESIVKSAEGTTFKWFYLLV